MAAELQYVAKLFSHVIRRWWSENLQIYHPNQIRICGWKHLSPRTLTQEIILISLARKLSVLCRDKTASTLESLNISYFGSYQVTSAKQTLQKSGSMQYSFSSSSFWVQFWVCLKSANSFLRCISPSVLSCWCCPVSTAKLRLPPTTFRIKFIFIWKKGKMNMINKIFAAQGITRQFRECLHKLKLLTKFLQGPGQNIQENSTWQFSLG